MKSAPASSAIHAVAARLSGAMVLAAWLLAGPVTARAETVFNITGVGCVSDIVLLADGTVGSGCFGAIDQGFVMTGTVTLDVYGAADGFAVDPVSAAGVNWVRSSFEFSWTGPASGSYDGQLPGASSSENYAAVYNDLVYQGGYGQELASGSSKSFNEGANQGSTNALLVRLTAPNNGSWLSDLSFVETAGLAPGPAATNNLDFTVLGLTQDLTTGQILAVYPGSLQGTFQLTSMTISAIPEPGTGLLALAGLAVVALALRGRTGAAA